MIQFRKYNEDQIELYKNSNFCIDKYKNLTTDQLLELQTSDEQLQIELSFTCQLKRIHSLHKRQMEPARIERKKLQKIRDDLFERQYVQELKKQEKQVLLQKYSKIITQNNITQLTQQISKEVPEKKKNKNYIYLFKQELQDPSIWTQEELSIRNEFLKELENIKNTQGGCSSCKRNALVRKYTNKLIEQQGNI